MAGLATNQTIELYRLSPYVKGLVPKEQKKYTEKLVTLDCDDPYLFPSELWKSNELPNINEHDVFQYCVAKHSKNCGLQLSAYKAIRDAEQYVSYGWVKDVFSAKLPNSVFIVTCRVHHSQSIRKSLLNPWAAIARDLSIICSSCDCEAGLGETCSHVGGMLYKIIAVNSMSCTSKENRWIDTSNVNDLKLFKRLSGMNETIYKSKGCITKSRNKVYDSAEIPLMSEEEQNEFEKVLLNNKALQLQVVNKNEVFKHFQPPDLPVAFGTLFKSSLVGDSYEEVIEECERLQASSIGETGVTWDAFLFSGLTHDWNELEQI